MTSLKHLFVLHWHLSVLSHFVSLEYFIFRVWTVITLTVLYTLTALPLVYVSLENKYGWIHSRMDQSWDERCDLVRRWRPLVPKRSQVETEMCRQLPVIYQTNGNACVYWELGSYGCESVGLHSYCLLYVMAPESPLISCHQTRFITAYRRSMNLAEIRIVFVHDVGTSMEGLQPWKVFPAEGGGCVCSCVTVWMYRM